MKNTLTTILCILLSAALAAGAVCIGARNGWLKERDNAIAAFSGGESADSFETRAMDAANLYVVAARHLSADDPRLAALQDARATLQSQTVTSSDKAQADVALTSLAQELSTVLPALDSVQASPRDQVYVAALTRTLTQGHDAVAYALSARDFNQRMEASLTGRLAMLLGVDLIDIP